MSNKKIILRPYQKDIIEQTVKSKKSTLIQIPTGGGKTVIAKSIIFKLWRDFDFQILFVAPKIVLMEQTMEVFKGLNPKLVHGQSKYTNRDKILVSTIQTASRRENLQPNVIIIDEVHYGFDGSMIKNLIKNKPNTRVIGLSATPYDRKGKLLKGFDLILDKYDIKYMIEHNYLVHLKTFVLVKQDLSHVKITAGDYNLNELSKVVCNKNTILEIVKTTEKYILESKKTIVFAVDIAHAELLTKAYTQNGFKTKALHSKMKKDEVNREIESFKKGEIKVLVSVLMLTTGFDVPDTDCAVIARPTKSQNLYKQMVGRVLRTAKKKKYATLLDCGNVVENLGMPLEPIREIDGNIIQNRLKCSQCESERLKLFKKDKKVYWKCKDCGLAKEIQQATYKCIKCKKEHTYKSSFRLTKNKLFLDCICGEETLISSYMGNEKFVEIKEEQQDYLSFEEARKFVHKLKLQKRKDWKKYCNGEYKDKISLHSKIPKNPHIIYANKGWKHTEDWIGIERKVVTKKIDTPTSLPHQRVSFGSKVTNKKIDTPTSLPHQRVRLGSKVTLIDQEDDSEVCYSIVVSQEFNPQQSLISIGSPMGRALLGKEEGDEVEVNLPNDKKVFNIEEITRMDNIK